MADKGSAAPGLGGHPGAGGFRVIGGSRSARASGIGNPSCCGQKRAEGRIGPETPLPPPRESSTDKSFKQTALNWNYRGIYPTPGETPLGAKASFVGYFWG